MDLISHKVSVMSLLSLSAMFLLICPVTGSNKANQSSCKMQPPAFCYGGIPGMDGEPGSPGAPGRDGRDGRVGAKSDQGSPGKTGPQGPPGAPGKHGNPGSPGRDGHDGRVGARGEKGSPGMTGPLGHPGMPGIDGKNGIKGEPGDRGSPGLLPYKNWKECAWKNLNDFKAHGLIKNCVFFKKFSDTSLHVYWTGSLRIAGCDDCCKRWYFTFNGVECSGPLPIDGVVYMWEKGGNNPHRVRHIEGYCNNIHQGKVRVGFSVGDCGAAFSGDVAPFTGYLSVSRIFVEEVPKPQA